MTEQLDVWRNVELGMVEVGVLIDLFLAFVGTFKLIFLVPVVD